MVASEGADTADGAVTADETDKRKLLKRLRFREFRHTYQRAAVALLMLIPVLRHGIVDLSDQILVAALGVVCAGSLLYGVLKHVAKFRRDTGTCPSNLLLAVAALLGVAAIVGGGSAFWVLYSGSKQATFVSLAALAVAAGLGWRVLRKIRTRADDPRAPDSTLQQSGYEAMMAKEKEFAGTAIACSGGGIRAAAFCLGGLQRLRQGAGENPSLYDGATRVFAVSGGGYIATALHLARFHSSQEPEVQRSLFAPGSHEEDRLRRRSKYLLPSESIVSGALSVIYGIAVNLALIGIVIYAAAWYISWLQYRVVGMCGTEGEKAECLVDGGVAIWSSMSGQLWVWDPPSDQLLAYISDRLIVYVGLTGLIVGIASFALIKTVSKYRPRGDLPGSAFIRSLAVGGFVVWVVTILVPWTIVNAQNATLNNEPTAIVAKAMSAARLATPAACKSATVMSFREEYARATSRALDPASPVNVSYGACGDTWTDDARLFAPSDPALTGKTSADACTPAESAGSRPKPTPSFCDELEGDGISNWESVAAWIAAAGALAAATRALFKGVGSPTRESGKTSKLTAFADAARRKVLPWSAVVVLAMLLALLLLLTVRDNLVNPDRLRSMPTVLIVLGVALSTKLLTDAILSSLHPFYRLRLSITFLVKRSRNNKGTAPLLYRRPTHVHRSGAKSGPELTICCAANISDRDYVPAARGCASFVFATKGDEGVIGISDARLPSTPLRKAQEYSATSDPQGIDTTLAAAMATSGAAFSPRAGRLSGRIRPYRVLLALGNARLGVWLPNPYRVRNGATVAPAGKADSWRQGAEWTLKRAGRAGPFRLFKEAFGALSIYDELIYVTDGGHYDNTGIVEALRNRPRMLIVLDASADPRDSLDALGDAIVTARMDLGLVVTPATPSAVTNIKGSINEATGTYTRPIAGWMHLRVATVEEPDEILCNIYFVKNVLTSIQMNIGLETYSAKNPAFPSTSTNNQFYGEYDFEAYRLLGYMNTAAMMAAAIPADLGGGAVTSV